MILCIIQARMSSSRLPGKNLIPILEDRFVAIPGCFQTHDFNMIDFVIGSTINTGINYTVIATSTDQSDNVIYKKYNVEKERDYQGNCYLGVYRGDLNNVLDRYYQTAMFYREKYNIKHIVRLTSDCPLLYMYNFVIDDVIQYHLENNFLFTTNRGNFKGYPSGLDVEVMSIDGLKLAYERAETSEEKEHVTKVYYNKLANEFNDMVGFWECDFPFNYKYSIDTMEDLNRVRDIFSFLQLR